MPITQKALITSLKGTVNTDKELFTDKDNVISKQTGVISFLKNSLDSDVIAHVKDNSLDSDDIAHVKDNSLDSDDIAHVKDNSLDSDDIAHVKDNSLDSDDIAHVKDNSLDSDDIAHVKDNSLDSDDIAHVKDNKGIHDKFNWSESSIEFQKMTTPRDMELNDDSEVQRLTFIAKSWRDEFEDLKKRYKEESASRNILEKGIEDQASMIIS